jgi:Spy/CpxP family protein refolding chaperone
MNSRLSPVLYLALVFISGVAVGALGLRFYSLSTASAVSQPPRNPEEFRKMYMAEMKTRLKLTPEQEQKLGVVLDETRDQFHKFREQHQPEMKAIQEEQVTKVNQFLTPEQQKEYTLLRAEHDAKRKAAEEKKPSR